MINPRGHKEGQVLIIVIVFSVISTIALLALFMNISPNYKIVVEETEYMKGYYAAIAGLRYASIMLENPAIVHQLDTTGTYTVPKISTSYATLFTDLVLKAPHDVAITITDGGGGNYTVTATYNFH